MTRYPNNRIDFLTSADRSFRTFRSINMSVKRVSYLGLFLCISLVISYIEAVLPPLSGIPGVKPGLSNVVTLLILKLFGKEEMIRSEKRPDRRDPVITPKRTIRRQVGAEEAFIVLIARILLSGLLFGNAFSFVFSLSGGLLALAVMSAAAGCERFSLMGVSMLGGVFHNLGQLVSAAFLIQQLKLAYYGPVLMVSGLIAGALTGFIASLLLPRLKELVSENNYPGN